MKKSQQKHLDMLSDFANQLTDLLNESAKVVCGRDEYISILSQATVFARQIGKHIESGGYSNEFISRELGYLYGLMAAAVHVASNRVSDLIHPQALK